MYRVILSPHLDDETICLGGSIAKWDDDNDPIVVIEMFNDDTICGGKKVAATERMRELTTALVKICENPLVKVVFPNRGYEDNSHLASIGEAVGVIESYLTELQIDQGCLYFPCPTEHQDHQFCHQVGNVLMRASASRKFMFYEYPMPYRAFDNVLDGTYIDVTAFAPNKLNALDAFESQMRGSGNMNPDTIIQFGNVLAKLFGSEGSVYEKVILRRSFE